MRGASGSAAREALGGARDLGALGAQRAGRAAGVVGGALGGPAVLVGGARPLQADGGAGLRLGGLVGQFAQLDLPAGPLAEPEGESGEGVGRPAGALRRLLALVADAGGVGGGLVGLRADGAGLGAARPAASSANSRAVAARLGEFGERPGRAVGAPGGEARGERTVACEPGGERPDLVVAGGGAGPEGLPLLVGGVLVVHGRVRRDEEDAGPSGRRPCRARVRGEQCGGGADGDGGAGQQGGVGEDLAGPGVRVGVGDDDAVDQLGPGGEHGGVVGGVDGLGEVAPAGQGRDAVLAEVLDGGEDVGARRQQPAVAERAEDAGVVGGGGAQVEELPLGGGDPLVEKVAQLVGVPVEFLGVSGPAAWPRGAVARRPRSRRRPARACRRAARRTPRPRPGGCRGAPGRLEQLREAFVRGDGLGGAALRLVARARRPCAASAARAAASSARDSAAAALPRVLGRARARPRGRCPRRRRRTSPRRSRRGPPGPGRRRARVSSSQPARTASAVSCSTSVSRWRRCPISLRARCASVAAAVASRCAASPDLLEARRSAPPPRSRAARRPRRPRAARGRGRRRPWRGRRGRGPRRARPRGSRRRRGRSGRRRRGGAGRPRRPARPRAGCGRRSARGAGPRHAFSATVRASEACR